MTAWENFNKEIEKLAQEAAVGIRDKVESGEIGMGQVSTLQGTLRKAVGDFYGSLFDQLKKGYDPANFDLTGAIKDLTLSMFDVMSAGGASTVAKQLVQKKGQELGTDIGKRIAGFDTPTADFKSPMARTVESTTKILGDNAIGRTLGRIFGLIDELFNPNKARDEYRRIDAMLEQSKSDALDKIRTALQPLQDRAFDVGQNIREKNIQASNFKDFLEERFVSFLQTLKKYPEIMSGMKEVLIEKKMSPDFFLDLIKRTKAYLNSPTEADLRDERVRGKGYTLKTTATIPQRLQKAGIFEDWGKILNFMLYQPAIVDKPSLAPFTTQSTSTQKGASGFEKVTKKVLDVNKLFGFDTMKDWLWTSNWSIV